MSPAGEPLSAPQRLAFVCDAVGPWHKGGRERRLQEIVKRLHRRDREIHVYTMNWWNGPAHLVEDGIHYHAICRHRPLYRNGRRSIAQALLFSLAIFKLLFESFDRLDVDHMPFFPLYTARIVAWLKGRRLTATWHEVWGYRYWSSYIPGPFGLIGYLVERISFSLPDLIVSVSPLTTRKLREHGARCPIETIPLGVDFTAIAAVAPAEMESDIIYVGRLLAHKGLDHLVDAIAMMTPARSGLRALIVGGGPEEASIRRRIQDRGVAANIHLYGEVDTDERLYALMKSSKLLVLPSIREGFGLVVLEANAAGIPVVTTNHESNAAKDLIRENVNGCLAAPTAADLREKMEHVLASRVAMKPDQEIAQYDWSFVARRLENIFAHPSAG